MKFLAQRLGTQWPHIAEARERTRAQRAKLDALASLASEDAATIMYGSIGREEVTESSDVDWTILIDGPSDPSHFQLVTKTAGHLKALGFTAPGRTDTFAVLVNSHEPIHSIAGTHDTNQNLTRRILLLFESIAVTQPLVRERVMRNILDRYIAYDVVVPRPEPLQEVIPSIHTIASSPCLLIRSTGPSWTISRWVMLCAAKFGTRYATQVTASDLRSKHSF